MNQKPDNKNFNLTLARAYAMKRGYWSLDISAEDFDMIQKIEVGGRLILNVVPEESRKKETSPQAYFQYMTKEQVQSFKAKAPKRPQPSKPRPKAAEEMDV